MKKQKKYPQKKSVKKKRVKKKIEKRTTGTKFKVEKRTPHAEFKMDKKTIRIGIISLVVLLVVIGILVFFRVTTVDTVTVEGNVHYTKEEVQEMVLGGRFGHNSVYLALKYKDREINDIPFIETMDVTITAMDSVKITVYEKAMAGYVEYMGQYFYFDKDGTIVESSEVKTLGIPQIMGLSFDHVVLLEKLPVENEEIFKQILDITQLLNKHEIKAEKIYFDRNYEMTLYYDEARIKLGSTDSIDEKIMKLKMILPEITDKKGVLRMENYTSDSQNVTFELEN